MAGNAKTGAAKLRLLTVNSRFNGVFEKNTIFES
jgi:hypothetical protein